MTGQCVSRLAWFSPIPPVRSGISQYNRELLPALTNDHDIDVFVDGSPELFQPPVPSVRVFSAYDFLWKVRAHPYDLMVYQIGNAPCHDYMWAYLVRYPGLVILHDGQLHHARGRTLLQLWPQRPNEYREEFWFNHPDANADLAQLGAAGLLGSLTYLWPMLRAVVESSRRILVHNHWLADQIREAHQDTAVDAIDMGVPESAPRTTARQDIRARHGIADESVVFMAFGKVTPEKRLREALHALVGISGAAPHAHLLLAGETVEYYDLRAEAQRLGIDEKVTIAGYIADEEIDDYLAAADVCLSMRWPTSRETSASWIRCLAAGKPTITTDLAHTVDMPTLDPRNWSVLEARLKSSPTDESSPTEEQTGEESIGPVGVSIDILDEDHSLELAMQRLATDARLRATLGANARALWNDRFRLDVMVAAYGKVIRDAIATPSPDATTLARMPAHLRATGLEYGGGVLRAAGLSADAIAGLWTPEHD
ncbi:MAG TPA: glycosyltransferase family 4 protein [Vicinamibacterales bacterium]|nr:glycosyltransferase family 4 protein [Vicinamibacterales bacterium]